MDVIVGGVILGIGISAILSVTSRSLARQTDGEKRMVAAWLADELLNMVLVEGPVRYPQLYDTNGVFYEPFRDFAYDVNIEDQGIGVPFEVTATVLKDPPRKSYCFDENDYRRIVGHRGSSKPARRAISRTGRDHRPEGPGTSHDQ